MAKKEKEDLVPYYRPGTTEPEMVPRSSVPGYVEPGAEDESGEAANEPADDEVDESVAPAPRAAATKKAAARKK